MEIVPIIDAKKRRWKLRRIRYATPWEWGEKSEQDPGDGKIWCDSTLVEVAPVWTSQKEGGDVCRAKNAGNETIKKEKGRSTKEMVHELDKRGYAGGRIRGG